MPGLLPQATTFLLPMNAATLLPLLMTSPILMISSCSMNFAPGEAIALLSAGAYGFVMASNYNSRGLPVEILVDGDQAKVIRPRQTMDDILASEKAVLRPGLTER